MRVEHVASGLWRWTAPPAPPELLDGGSSAPEVGSVYVEGDDAVVLIDPLVPREALEAERFWGALDRDLGRLRALPLVVLLTCAWHRRSAADVLGRYAGRPGTRVLAHAESAPFLADLAAQPIREREALPGGIEARVVRTEPLELALWLARDAALVTAEALVGTGGGGLSLCPPSWVGGPAQGAERLRSQVVPALVRLLDLPIERVLPSHGEPVLAGGREAIAAALAALEEAP